MGNKLARNRLKAQDFHYIAKNTAFLTNDVNNWIIDCCTMLCSRLCWTTTLESWRSLESQVRWTLTPSKQSSDSRSRSDPRPSLTCWWRKWEMLRRLQELFVRIDIRMTRGEWVDDSYSSNLLYSDADLSFLWWKNWGQPRTGSDKLMLFALKIEPLMQFWQLDLKFPGAIKQIRFVLFQVLFWF